jgi:hypothetical protein
MIAAGVTLWLLLSALVCWLWGRFVRVGMVELQPQHQVEEAQP